MKKRIAAAVLTTLPISTVTAQAVRATATAGELTASTSVSATVAVPLGSDISAGVSVTSQGTGSIGTAAATTTVLPLVVGDYEVRARMQCSAQATANIFFSQLEARAGRLGFNPATIFAPINDVILGLSATVPVRGRLEVAFQGQSNGQQNTINAFYSIDVNNDGVLERVSIIPAPAIPPLSFGPGNLQVRISTIAGHRLQSEFPVIDDTSDLTVRFVPDSDCTASVQAPACGSVRLQPQPNFTFGIDQIVQNLQPPGQTVVALVYGVQVAAIPVPLPPRCLLGTTPIATRILFGNAAGEARHSLVRIPPAMRPTTFFVQAFELDPQAGTAVASETQRIDCR